jgi:hypothetical protein
MVLAYLYWLRMVLVVSELLAETLSIFRCSHLRRVVVARTSGLHIPLLESVELLPQ